MWPSDKPDAAGTCHLVPDAMAVDYAECEYGCSLLNFNGALEGRGMFILKPLLKLMMQYPPCAGVGSVAGVRFGQRR